MNKGEMMRKVYSTEELRNIDSALPIQYWKLVDIAIHVMNYNEPNTLGKVENMEEIAKKRGINLNLDYPLSKEDAMKLIKQGHKITHICFSDDEFIEWKLGQIKTEEGYHINEKEFFKYRHLEVWDNNYKLY